MIFTTWRFWLLFVLFAALGTWVIFLLGWNSSPWRILIYIVNGTLIVALAEHWNQQADDKRYWAEVQRNRK